MIRVPSSVKHYLDDENNVPLIAHNGSMWFHITQKEKDINICLIQNDKKK